MPAERAWCRGALRVGVGDPGTGVGMLEYLRLKEGGSGR